MRRRRRRVTHTLHATTWSRWQHYAGSSSLILLLLPIAALVLGHFGITANRWTTAGAFCFFLVWASWYQRAIQSKPKVVRALRPGAVHAVSAKPGALSVNLVPSPLSTRGILRNVLPLLVAGALAEVVGVVGVFVLRLPEVVLAGLSWLVAGGALVGMLVAARRPARPHQRLRVRGKTVAWLDAKREAVLAECALDELVVERRRFTATTRFGTSVQLCLALRFPGGQKLYFGLDEGSVGGDSRFVAARKAPSLLVGRGEWDALVKRLP